MTQICKNCGQHASEEEKYCPNCFSELDTLKEEKKKQRKKTAEANSIKGFWFSVVNTVIGVSTALFIFFMMKNARFVQLMLPIGMFAAITAISVFFAVKGLKSKNRNYSLYAFGINAFNVIVFTLLVILLRNV